MSEAPAPAPAPAEAASLAQMWADSLGQVLSQVSGAPQPCGLTDQAPAAAAVAEGELWILGTCSGGLRGEMSLRLSAATTLRIAQTFMSEPATPEAPVT